MVGRAPPKGLVDDSVWKVWDLHPVRIVCCVTGMSVPVQVTPRVTLLYFQDDRIDLSLYNLFGINLIKAIYI